MSEADFDFAVHITGKMGWELAEQDFEFMIELEPEGCFVLQEDSARIGIATTVSFGKIAWFGNLIVDQNKRNKGAGSMLVNHALMYLRGKKVQTVGLYAYMERVPFYRRLGFRPQLEFVVLKGTGYSSASSPSTRKAETQDFEKIMKLDHYCFGTSRRKMLEPILMDTDNLCYLSTNKEDIHGYSVAKIFNGKAELGPVVCRKGHIGALVDLIKALMNELEGLEVSMFVPSTETALLTILLQKGFRENFRVERMIWGPSIGRGCVYLAESLERG